MANAIVLAIMLSGMAELNPEGWAAQHKSEAFPARVGIPKSPEAPKQPNVDVVVTVDVTNPSNTTKANPVANDSEEHADKSGIWRVGDKYRKRVGNIVYEHDSYYILYKFNLSGNRANENLFAPMIPPAEFRR